MTDVWVEREEEFCDDAPDLRTESPWSLNTFHISRELTMQFPAAASG